MLPELLLDLYFKPCLAMILHTISIGLFKLSETSGDWIAIESGDNSLLGISIRLCKLLAIFTQIFHH